MAVHKRESRLRRWARKLGSCLRNHHPHRKYKSASYVDMGKTASSPVRRPDVRHTPRKGLIDRREQPPKKGPNGGTKVWDGKTKWAAPSAGSLRKATLQDCPPDETIRLVNASVNSLVGGRLGSQTPRFAGRVSKRALGEPRKQQADLPGQLEGPRSVLSWQESFELQRALRRELPPPPPNRYDSAVDVTIRPLHVRKHQVQRLYCPSGLGRSTAVPVQPKSTANSRILHAPAFHSQTALPTADKEPVRGWEQDWERPLQQRIGDSRAIWKSASHRLLLRNKDSIQQLDAEQAIMEQMTARMELEKMQQPQMRSIQSIEEMAEEDRRAEEEWSGIANQLAFDAQLPGVQEVKFVSFRHQKRHIANARR
ncbi:hypothetical protein BKA58DRAFT_322127 [Alternaria rosae]|uniref:uncharacterized protein n=1 Tax=Alternaria rosae TaxID=1187941 RepID=UPI001E8ECA0D|nr:uncharacterized protein BKA58DRAFT_322127 [Alternaria rosae]KAH6864877.1 hypothetical protein BKA58DRAFT_322127 [Alternaria rosae]